MRAICLIPNEGVKLQDVNKPEKAEPGHLLIKMISSAINPGDKAFINRALPPGSVVSLYHVYGVSGVGKVLEIGAGVPEAYRGKNVTMYRSLKFSESMIGTWCEYSHMHFLDCVILPDDVNPKEYSGSVVNMITPYAFQKQITKEGHRGIISTAGTSATGIAMVGICQAYDFPLVSIVRNEKGRKELEALGAKNIAVQDDYDFAQHLKEMSQKAETTAVFDGVGGEVLNKIIEVIPNNSTIYSYGYLGDAIPLTVHTRTLTSKGITIKPFGNFRTETVQNPQNLAAALAAIGELIHLPHFKTKIGKKFKLEEINEALLYSPENGEKAILSHFE
ncbi:zinc-binding dehydrogenase [Pedobacter sp. L105]|uniref:zinc-binding dehydrogenase n=1 Tax=Pedobacter sp. L105 TaxID=1641871 RepID=UPI001C208279|nr:zinc-binding dehydrogenase [Pedobacter sp. L105]